MAFASLWLASANCSTRWIDAVRAELGLRILQEAAWRAYANVLRPGIPLSWQHPRPLPYRRSAESLQDSRLVERRGSTFHRNPSRILAPQGLAPLPGSNMGTLTPAFRIAETLKAPEYGAFRFSDGGSAEIRTLGRVSPSAVFKTAAFNHSATLPDKAGAIVPDRNTLSNTDTRHPTCLCYDPGQIVSGLNSSKECRHARTRIRA